ncbi:MAG: hypothetical protein LBL24_01945 [Bacteroidales bacterium]|jgi:hypothetical protein|nr:hypothetical protein [Bacteroidales bacterium]
MKKPVLLFALCACIFAGCSKEPKDTSEQQADCRVTVILSAASDSKSLLKSDASVAEEDIDRLMIFGVNASDGIDSIYIISDPPANNIVPITVSRKVKSLYAIANHSVAMEALTPASVADLLAITGDFSAAPQSPFLMGGNGNIIAAGGNYTASVQLIRAVAKIAVIGKNDFTIETVTVKETPDQGYVFKTEPLSVPAATRINYNPVASADPVLYVAENSSETPTQFLVTGTFDSKPASYTVELKKDGQFVDIVRNTFYKVHITPITEDECAVTFSIPDWDDEDTDDHVIPDSAFE